MSKLIQTLRHQNETILTYEKSYSISNLYTTYWWTNKEINSIKPNNDIICIFKLKTYKNDNTQQSR